MFTQGRIRVVALAIADVACISVVWAAVVYGYWLLGRGLENLGVNTSMGGYTPVDYWGFWPVVFVFPFFNALFELYHGNWMYPAIPLSPVEEMRRLVGSSLLTHLAVLAYLVLAYQTTQGCSRVVIVISGIFTAFAAQSFRNWIRWILLKLDIGQISVLLAGGREVAAQIVSILEGNPYLGVKVVGYFEGVNRFSENKRRQQWYEHELSAYGIQYLGSLRDIVPEARRRDIKILLASQDERFFRQQMEEFTSWFTYIEYLPTSNIFPIFGARAISLDGIGGLEMINQGRMKVKRLQKRMLDILLAVVASLLFLPAFMILPPLIKLTSRGPVFYRHRRLGKNGRPILIWKFRSMYEDADRRLKEMLSGNSVAAEEWNTGFKLMDDPRVTWLGRFLRKTSLDEIPQLINVFSGEMSFIGPRPIVEEEVKYYGEAYRIFSSVSPGITGLWQVSGRSDTGYVRRIALDTYYVLNWSPWMDLWILVRTVYAVLFMRGAC